MTNYYAVRSVPGVTSCNLCLLDGVERVACARRIWANNLESLARMESQLKFLDENHGLNGVFVDVCHSHLECDLPVYFDETENQ